LEVRPQCIGGPAGGEKERRGKGEGGCRSVTASRSSFSLVQGTELSWWEKGEKREGGRTRKKPGDVHVPSNQKLPSLTGEKKKRERTSIEWRLRASRVSGATKGEGKKEEQTTPRKPHARRSSLPKRGGCDGTPGEGRGEEKKERGGGKGKESTRGSHARSSFPSLGGIPPATGNGRGGSKKRKGEKGRKCYGGQSILSKGRVSRKRGGTKLDLGLESYHLRHCLLEKKKEKKNKEKGDAIALPAIEFPFSLSKGKTL